MDTEASSQYKYGGEQDKINNQLHREIISVRMELGVVFDNILSSIHWLPLIVQYGIEIMVMMIKIEMS